MGGLDAADPVPPLGQNLTFKGGTSLSKTYKVIDRFSEDIDLTLDIRCLIPEADDELPDTRSRAGKWTTMVRQQLPAWIEANVRPVIQESLARDGIQAKLTVADDGCSLGLEYPAVVHRSRYVAPVVKLEFGARSTGEPHQVMSVACDMDSDVLPQLSFPAASPQVMAIARTFWEKATAAHVYCAQNRLRGDRFARHWHDLAAIAHSVHADAVVSDRTTAARVAQHKSLFFREKDIDGHPIAYQDAIEGRLRLVPDGPAREALARDYAAMVEDGILLNDTQPFDELMETCAGIEKRVNHAFT